MSRKVYEKYCNGDPISDSELAEALEFFNNIERDLRALGPVFQLAANEALRVKQGLQGFSSARAEH